MPRLPKLIGVRRAAFRGGAAARQPADVRGNWEEKREGQLLPPVPLWARKRKGGALKHFAYAFHNSQPLTRFKASRRVHSNNPRTGPWTRMRIPAQVLGTECTEIRQRIVTKYRIVALTARNMRTSKMRFDSNLNCLKISNLGRLKILLSYKIIFPLMSKTVQSG